MKKQTKQQKFNDAFDAYRCLQKGQPIKRSTNKDGSLPTTPIIACPDLPESEVLKLCLAWLRGRRIFCNRVNNGKGDLHGDGHVYTYGIIGAGDILGLLPDGRHFEVECKKGRGGLLSKDQRNRAKRITENNGIYIIAHGIPELNLLLGPYL